MIPVGRRPAVGRMAVLTTGRESRGGMIGISRAGVSRLVTGIAISRRAGESGSVT